MTPWNGFSSSHSVYMACKSPRTTPTGLGDARQSPSYFMPGPAELLHSFRILAAKYLPYGGLPCWSHGLSSACMPAKPQCGTLEGRGLGTTPEFRTWAKLAQRWQVLVHRRPFARTIDRERGSLTDFFFVRSEMLSAFSTILRVVPSRIQNVTYNLVCTSHKFFCDIL